MTVLLRWDCLCSEMGFLGLAIGWLLGLKAKMQGWGGGLGVAPVQFL